MLSCTASSGWAAAGGVQDTVKVAVFEDTAAGLDADGCARYVVTDIKKDGMLSGPNLDLLRHVCSRTARPVIASGGVSSLADLEAIAALVPDGGEGAIVGKALYAGAFTLEEALEAVAA